jgi:hypothetical protein
MKSNSVQFLGTSGSTKGTYNERFTFLGIDAIQQLVVIK